MNAEADHTRRAPRPADSSPDRDGPAPVLVDESPGNRSVHPDTLSALHVAAAGYIDRRPPTPMTAAGPALAVLAALILAVAGIPAGNRSVHPDTLSALHVAAAGYIDQRETR